MSRSRAMHPPLDPPLHAGKSSCTNPAAYTCSMEVRIGGVPVHCAEYGNGVPVLALHGAGVDHREVAGALEPVFSNIPNYRRLDPDLQGMGLTPAPGTITSN